MRRSAKQSLSKRRRGLNSNSVLSPVEGLVFPGVTVAFIGSAIGEAALAELVAEIESAGDDANSEAGPHQYQKWATNTEAHRTGVFLHRLGA